MSQKRLGRMPFERRRIQDVFEASSSQGHRHRSNHLLGSAELLPATGARGVTHAIEQAFIVSVETQDAVTMIDNHQQAITA